MSDQLAQFANQKFISLETFRKNGVGVPTVVWFIVDNGVLYVSSPSHTGKVKRLQNNPRVRVAPANPRGEPIGAWVEGQARFVSPEDGERVERLLDRKYGFQKRLLNLLGRLRGWKNIVYAVQI